MGSAYCGLVVCVWVHQKSDAKLERDGDELALDRAEKFVEVAAQDRRYVQRAGDGLQAADLLGRIAAPHPAAPA